MTKRHFLTGLTAMLPLPFLKQPKSTNDWVVHVCAGGSTEGENLAIARSLATSKDCEVRFTFNYHRHYCVFPNGTMQKVDDDLW